MVTTADHWLIDSLVIMQENAEFPAGKWLHFRCLLERRQLEPHGIHIKYDGDVFRWWGGR